MWFSVSEYWAPLATVPSWEFDGYLDALEETLEEKLEESQGYRPQMSVTSPDTYARNDLQGVERRVYRDLLEGLEDVEDKTDLMQYSKDMVENPDTVLPAPLNFFTEAMDRIFYRDLRGSIVHDVFEEAKDELE
jgi:hypothetical protein